MFTIKPKKPTYKEVMQTLKNEVQRAVQYANSILAKQKRIMHPAKYALMLEVYKLAHKRTFRSYRFYKQAKGCYKMHCFFYRSKQQ